MSAMPPVHDWLLPYHTRLRTRSLEDIDLAIMHCTELPDLTMARAYGERILHADSQTGNCGHYYLDRDGAIHRFVEEDRIAHHTVGYNTRSIGIEMVNRGRWPDWQDSRRQTFDERYTDAQVRALNALLAGLRTRLPSLRWIAGHEDLDRRLEPASDDPGILLPRRRDPGPHFPWAEVLADCGLQRLDDAAT